MAANDKISEDINKRTNKIAADNKSTDFAQSQMAANQVQQINSERRTNMALQRQELEQQSGTTELLASAGAMTAMNDGSGATIRQLNPATQAMLGKYTGGPRVQQSRSHDVKVQPNHIVIHNNYNTTTTNNVNAGPLQGREVSIKPVEPPGQSRFKTWISNVFARQKEETIRREKEYDKREWSLAKSANKMLRKMEDATRSVAETFNPKNLGTTIGSQFKTLLFLFGLRFLAKNWTRVLSVSKKIFEGVGNIVSFLGFGPEGKKLAAKGDDLAGKFIKFFGGDPKKDTILSLLKDMFTEVLDHIRLYFEKQMALRGAAIKSIKFPGFNFGNDNQDKGWLGNMMDSLFSKLGIVFSGVTGYLGDILTALVDPKAGVSRNIIREGLDSSKKATERKGEASMFKNHDNGFNAGDYALVEKGDNGRKKYSLLANALEGDGSLKKTAAAQISQGRDILGTINDAQEYGKLDSGRLMSGLERLYNSAKRNKSVVVDKEFIDRLFGPNGLAKLMSSGQATEVRMKFVEDKMTAEDHALEDMYANRVHGDRTIAGEAVKGAWKPVEAVWDAVVNTDLKAAGKDLWDAATASPVVGAWQTGKRYFETNDKKYTLVPEDDPRPAAIIDGKRPGIQTFYSITPEALQSLAKNSFGVQNNRGFDSSNYEALIANSEKYLTGKAGGEVAANQKWHSKGQAFFGEGSAQRTDYGRYQELKNIEDSYDTQLKNDAFSRRWTTVGNNAKDLMNQGIGYLNRGIDWAANKYMDMTSAKNATYSYDARPIAPVDTGVQFNPQAAVEALHRNAFSTPQHRCAEMTRKAIAAGLGVPDTRAITGAINSAADYSGALGKLGYAPLSWSTYQPRVGDVLVEPRLPGHEHGHMAMYDGTRWVSDFPQRDMWGGSVFRKYKKGIVFRHLSMGGGDSNMLQMDNNTVQTQDPEYYGASSYSSYVGDGGYGFSASGNIGGANFNVSGNVSSSPIYTSQSRGEWFNQHRQKWEGVLRQAGYNESDSTRLSTFFAAQDGFESGGEKANDATKARHNWGGMQSGGKNISYSSDEEYMRAKLKMMQEKFGNAMQAQDLPSYIRMLHDPRVNGGYAYNVASGFNAKTGQGWDAQQRAMENYVRGSLSFARSGMQYGGDNNPLFAMAADGGDYAYDAPDILSFSVKTPAQLAREKDMMIHREEAAKIWNLAKDNNMVLIDPETRKAFTAEHFIELYATGRIKREDIKNKVKNYAEGRRYYNELDPYVKNKYFKGKSEVQFARDMKNMSQSEVKGFKQYYDRISMGMQNYDTWMKGLTKEELKEFAKAIHATNIYGGVDLDILKAQYEAVLKGMFNRDDDTSNRFAASILYGQDYFKSGEQGKKALAKMAKNTETYMSYTNKANTKYSAHSKVEELMNLQKSFANFEDKKRALELKYDKIIRDAGTALTQEEFTRITEQFDREYRDLLAHQEDIQDNIDKLVESAKDEEKKFIEKKLQQERLLKTSRENLQAEFTNLRNTNISFIDAVNEMVSKYGEEVLEKLYGVKGLTKHDLEDRDFGKEYEAQRKIYEANVEKYGSDTSKWPSPITRDDGESVAASAYRRNAAADSEQGKADGITKAKGTDIIKKGEAGKIRNTWTWKPTTSSNRGFEFKGFSPTNTSGTFTGTSVTYNHPDVKIPMAATTTYAKPTTSGRGKKTTTATPTVKKKGKAEGGYTEDGPKYKEAGVVHAGEWVAPQWMVKSAKFGPIIGALESSRIKARAIGDSKKAEGSLNDASRGDIVKAINQTTIAIAAASQTNAQNITNAANHASEVIQASARLSAPTRQAQVTPSITTNR